MATANNLVTVLPDTLFQDNDCDITFTCHEDGLDEIPCFGTFTLCLDEDNQCNVSVVTDDAFFFDDDLSTASSIDESCCIEEADQDDISRSTHTEIETDMEIKTPVVPPQERTMCIIQREERERKSLFDRRSLRERRRGGKKPTRNAAPAAFTIRFVAE